MTTRIQEKPTRSRKVRQYEEDEETRPAGGSEMRHGGAEGRQGGGNGAAPAATKQVIGDIDEILAGIDLEEAVKTAQNFRQLGGE